MESAALGCQDLEGCSLHAECKVKLYVDSVRMLNRQLLQISNAGFEVVVVKTEPNQPQFDFCVCFSQFEGIFVHNLCLPTVPLSCIDMAKVDV